MLAPYMWYQKFSSASLAPVRSMQGLSRMAVSPATLGLEVSMNR